MKRHLILLLCLIGLSADRIFAEPNPLIEQTLQPIPNPSFESGLTDWPGAGEAGGITMAEDDLAFDGARSLAVTIDKWTGPTRHCLSKRFQVPAGGRYFISIKVLTEGGSNATMQVDTQRAASRTLPESKWRELGAIFRSAAGDAGDHELRLYVFGEGRVRFDDIRVFRIKEYSQYLRVRLLEPTIEKYRVTVKTRVARPKEYFNQTYFAGDGVLPGAHSPWIDLNAGGDFSGSPATGNPPVISGGVHFETLSGTRFERITAEIDFASTPSEAGILKTLSATNEGNVVGIFFARQDAGPFAFVQDFRLLFDDAMERNRHVKSLGLPPIALKHFQVEAQLSGYRYFFSDPRYIDLEIDTIKRIGFNALGYTGLAGPDRQAAARAGIVRTHHSHRESSYYALPRIGKAELERMLATPEFARATAKSPTFANWLRNNPTMTVLDWDDIRRNIRDAVGRWYIRLKNEDPEQIPLIQFVDLGDEISGPVFGGEAHDAGYREFVQRQGLSPQDFGQTTWAGVHAIPWGSSNMPLPLMRPTNRNDIAACRQYYWSLRYWTWASARVYSIVTAEVEKRMPWVQTRINFGQPWYNAATDMRGTDVWEFVRQRGITATCNEDWLGPGSFSGIQLNAYLADLNRSCAMLRDLRVQAMVMPGNERIIQRKLASVVGKGVKDIDLFSYGPAYASYDNWSQNPSQVVGVSKFMRKLAKAEDVLFPGKPRKAEIAVIWSGSNEMWREDPGPGDNFDVHRDATLYNGHFVYLGLLHKQIPIDFIDEFEIENGRLDDYRIAYLSCRNLRRSAQTRIAEWVKGGGCLWTDALCAQEDEYGQDCDVLLPVLGMRDRRFERDELQDYRPRHGLPRHEPRDTITFKDTGETVAAIGMKVNFTVATPSDTNILATFNDGSPAVIEHRYGKGTAYFVPTLAGCSYGWTVKHTWGRINTGYRDTYRRLIADFPSRIGVNLPLTCSVPMVEADLLESEAGIAVVLANYAGDETLPDVQLRIGVTQSPKTVTSLTHGPLDFTYDTDRNTVAVALPLALVDILVIK
jgi:hypothetical protein